MLCEQGHHVVALVRAEPDPIIFEGLDVELLFASLGGSSANDGDSAGQDVDPKDSPEGDSSEEDPVAAAIRSCDVVVHAAAMIHLGWNHVDESMSVNRNGTRSIVDACLRFQKRLVHIGTVNTLAVGGPKTLADEDTPLAHAGGQVNCAYVVSKRAALKEVTDGVAKGLDAVILHPGFMLGPWDWKPSSGRMMLEIGRGWKPVAPSGGCSLCDVRDVARAVVAAISTETTSGRSYGLAGHNWTYLKLWTEMAKRMGARPPIRAAGPGLEYLAGLTGDLWGRITGKEPDVNSAGVAMSSQYHWYSSRRAQQELGYQTRPAQETLDAAADWVSKRFVLPPPDPSS